MSKKFVKKTKVTSKRWSWIKKRNCYGWKTFKVDRFICMERRARNNKTQNNISNSKDSESGPGDGGEVGRGGDRQEVGGLLFTIDENAGRERGLSAVDT